MTTGKTVALMRRTFVGKVKSLLFNTLSRLVITFLPRSKHILISWLQSPSAVILEPKKIKSLPISTVSSSICHEVMGPDAMIFVFWMLSFKPTFSLSSFTFIKRFFSSSSLFRLDCGAIYLREQLTSIHWSLTVECDAKRGRKIEQIRETKKALLKSCHPNLRIHMTKAVPLKSDIRAFPTLQLK